MKFFEGRKAIIATKHHKEQVILPLVKEQLEIEVFVPHDYDTDKFGTFTGEIPREGNALDAVRKKCLDAMNIMIKNIDYRDWDHLKLEKDHYYVRSDA